MKIANLLKAFKSNFSSDDSFEKVLTNKKILSIEKTFFAQKDFISFENKNLVAKNKNIEIKVTEDAIKESLKSYCINNKSYSLNTLFNSEFKDINFENFNIDELGLVNIELLECNSDSSTYSLLSDYYINYLVLRNEIENRLTTEYIYRILRNSITKVYKEIQSKFVQIPLKFTFFEFFDLVFSLKRSSNYNSFLIRICFIENLNTKYNDRKIHRVTSIFN